MLAPTADPRDPLAEHQPVLGPAARRRSPWSSPPSPAGCACSPAPGTRRPATRWRPPSTPPSRRRACARSRPTTTRPGRRRPGEHAAALELTLRDPEIFPLRTYERDAAERQGDPLAVLVRAMQGVGPGERLLLRLTLAPAPDGWARRYRPLLHAARRADEHGSAAPPPDRRPAGDAAGGLGFLLLLAALALGLWAWPVVAAIRAGQRPPGPLGIVPWERLVGAPPGRARRRRRPAAGAPARSRRCCSRCAGGAGPSCPRPTLLMTKLNAPGCLARLHVLAWAPDPRPRRRRPAARDGRPAALRPRRRQRARRPPGARIADPLAAPRLRGPFRRARVLSAYELAGPVGAGRRPGRRRRPGPRRRHPPPPAAPCPRRPPLAGGRLPARRQRAGRRRACRSPSPTSCSGASRCVLGKTGAGKSTALHHLLAHAMADPARGVLVVDPHGDLARALLGLVPRHRRADVIALDLADTERPIGLNPLDVTAGRPPDRLVADTITGLRRLWPNSWGDRMEQMLRQALITLVERNRAPAARRAVHAAARRAAAAGPRTSGTTVLTQLGPPVEQRRLVDRLLRPASRPGCARR